MRQELDVLAEGLAYDEGEDYRESVRGCEQSARPEVAVTVRGGDDRVAITEPTALERTERARRTERALGGTQLHQAVMPSAPGTAIGAPRSSSDASAASISRTTS